MRNRLENVPAIIVATAVLHNLALTVGDYVEETEVQIDDNGDIDYNQQLAGIAKRNNIVTQFFS